MSKPKDMPYLMWRVQTLLRDGVTVVPYSEQTQGLVGSSDVVLWNQGTVSITEQAYSDLTTHIRKPSSGACNYSMSMSYADFCISIVCCVGYSLNHKMMKDPQEKAFVSAWRLVHTLSYVGGDELSSWLSSNLKGRYPMGYVSMVGVSGFQRVPERRDGRGTVGKDSDGTRMRGELVGNRARRTVTSESGGEWSLTPQEQLCRLREIGRAHV